jgi:hypothetical protein
MLLPVEPNHKRKRQALLETPSLHTLLGTDWQIPYVTVQDVRKILTEGADIEERKGKPQHTPLHIAVMQHRTDIVEFLLDQGADMSALTTGGDTPLHLNAFAYTDPISALLLMNGASCNTQNTIGKTPTHIAAQHADAACLRNFLDFGADTSVKDNNGNTVLHYAADRTLCNPDDDESYRDIRYDRRENRKVVRLLLDYETDGVWSKVDALRATTNKGYTAMNLADHHASWWSDRKIGDMLEAALLPAEEEARRVVQTTFAMGYHERLGEASIVTQLNPDMLRMVLSYV